MSYNWKPASTAEGRERLKELLDKGMRIVGKVGKHGRITAFWKHEDGAYDIDCYLPEPFFLERNLADAEFLDPEPKQPEPFTIDQMREYCMNWAMSQSSGVEQQISLPLGLELRFRQYASELTWFLDKSNFPKFGNEPYKPYQRQEELPDVIEYLIIRAIERGEI